MEIESFLFRGCRQRDVKTVVIVAVVLLFARQLETKKTKKSWSPVTDQDEFVQKQSQVFKEASELSKLGDFIAAAKVIEDFSKRVSFLEKSGALGSNLLNTLGEYQRQGQNTAAAESSFEKAIGALKGYRAEAEEENSSASDQHERTRLYVEASELHRARTNLAKLREDAGDSNGAVAQLKSLLKEASIPEFRAMAAKELGVFHMRHDELELGKAYLEFAVEVHPAIPKGYSNLALVLHKLGELDEAEDAFMRAMKLEPDNPNIHSNLGTLYAQNGEFEDAKKQFRLALEKQPGHPDALEKMRQIREMEEGGELDADGMPKFRNPMKKVGGERKPKIKFEL